MSQNKTVKRDSMVFYRTFYEPLLHIPAKSRSEVLAAIIEYGLDGKSPKNLDSYGSLAFGIIAPLIDNARERYINCVNNGKKGGRPRKTKQSDSDNKNQDGLNNKNQIASKGEKLSDFSCQNLNEYVYDNDNDNEYANEYEYINDIQEKSDTVAVHTLTLGEYGNVFLSSIEKEKLTSLLGTKGYERSVDYLSRYIKRKPEYKSACHYEDLRGWVQDAVSKEEKAKERAYDYSEKQSTLDRFGGIDFEDIFEKP